MSASAVQLAKETLLSLTEFQRDIHILNEHDKQDIESVFHKKFIKSTWYSSVKMKLESTTDGDQTVYKVNDSFHYLEYSYRCFKTPAIRVKQEWIGKVRISWPHNLGNNVSLTATFKEDDDGYQTIDHVWGDIYPEFYQENGASGREGYNLGVGNVDYLEGWTDFLPAADINIEDPWFYSMDPADAYPIWPKGSSTKAEMRYTYRRKVADLLRLELYSEKDKIWRPQTKNFMKYIEVSAWEIKTPELWGRYSLVTNKELDYYNTCDDTWVEHEDENGTPYKQKITYIRDIAICDVPNAMECEKESNVELMSPNPCLAFFWAAENSRATAIHNYSNYTTNPDDIYKGWDPVKYTSLKYKNTPVFDKMDSHHFSIAQPRRHCASIPSVAGHHVYSNASDTTNFGSDIGIVYDGMQAKLSCYISNIDIFTSSLNLFNNGENDEDDDDNDNETETDNEYSESYSKKQIVRNNKNTARDLFLLRVRLLIVRKFTLTYKEGKYSYEIK